MSSEVLNRWLRQKKKRVKKTCCRKYFPCFFKKGGKTNKVNVNKEEEQAQAHTENAHLLDSFDIAEDNEFELAAEREAAGGAKKRKIVSHEMVEALEKYSVN